MDNAVKNLRGSSSAGIFLSLFGNGFYALSYAFAKKMVTKENGLEVAVVRIGSLYLYLAPVVIFDRCRVVPPKGERLFVFFFALLYCIGHFTMQYSLAFISLADASALSMLYPIMVTLVAPIILKEKFYYVYVVAAAVAVVGVVMIEKPSFLFGETKCLAQASDKLYGFALAFSSAIVFTGGCIINRKIQRTPAWVCLSYLSLLSVACYTIAILVRGKYRFPECGYPSMYALLSGLCMTLALFLCFLAYILSDPGPISVVGMIEVPLVLVLETAFIRETPTVTTLVGVSLVFSAVLITTLQKWPCARQKAARLTSLLMNACIVRKTKTFAVVDRIPEVFVISHFQKGINL